MNSAMDPADGEAWFGKAPPDLSLVARAKAGGPDWTYTFLKSFYVDETRPAGWNNTVLVGASMPNVLWHLQGTQRAIYGEHGEVTGFELAPQGSQSPEEFDRTIRDITAFLTYVGEPAALKREAYGVWVILFLTVFTFIAWLLKKEYWRDVH
jgi:ubiquinol-cytochrome c reductase cytochrome c1 subunit